MNADFYTQQIIVQDFETDATKRMTPGAILRRAQQISTDHCTRLGIDESLYQKTHTAFLLAKLAMQIYEPIPAGMQVTITTMPSAPQRAIYHRYTSFCDDAGKKLCEMDSCWILVNTSNKRILRVPPQDLPLPFIGEPKKLLDLTIQKAETEYVAEEKAVYTRCDQNHHLNNTSYADILCDHLPTDLLLNSQPQRLAITYHKEIPLGQSFQLSRATLNDKDYYFLGQSAGCKHFEAQFTFR
ncbi:acyl-[acyl-carrier-protein] thioesterase [uncultured Ruthenibacterium sp.]|uniref:acyl-[acyl-carrier-protein] thioesterase n=1 Tax=uncultured Ruthenibacterium sp. TaxID=1905347 RepID=UPI00349EA31F